jgi:hypothetical protein
MLKEVLWSCPCGTTLRYWNIVRQQVHERSQKHLQWKEDGVVISKKYKQRWRKPDDITIEKM